MSTKSHILYEPGSIEIYHETSENRDILGHWVGSDLYFYIDIPALKNFKIKDGFFYVESKIENIPNNLVFWGGNIVQIDFDSECLLIIFKGGSRCEKYLSNLDFSIFIRTQD